MKYIIGHDNWCKAYANDNDRKRIWIYIKTSDQKEIYLDEYDKWLQFQEYCNINNLNIEQIGLQYRSHCVTTEVKDAEAVYLVRSIKGEMHSVSKQCYTIGLLKNNKVHKTMWLTPALVEEMKTVDNIEDCFKEAFVYNVKKSKTV